MPPEGSDQHVCGNKDGYPTGAAGFCHIGHCLAPGHGDLSGASAHALYALLGLLAVWTVLDMTGLAAWTDSVIDLFLCALALFHGVWTLDCLLHDAYIGWRAKPHANGFASLIAMYLFFLTNAFRAGAVTATWLPLLFAGGGFGAVLGGVLWQQRREKGQTEDAAL